MITFSGEIRMDQQISLGWWFRSPFGSIWPFMKTLKPTISTWFQMFRVGVSSRFQSCIEHRITVQIIDSCDSGFWQRMLITFSIYAGVHIGLCCLRIRSMVERSLSDALQERGIYIDSCRVHFHSPENAPGFQWRWRTAEDVHSPDGELHPHLRTRYFALLILAPSDFMELGWFNDCISRMCVSDSEG